MRIAVLLVAFLIIAPLSARASPLNQADLMKAVASLGDKSEESDLKQIEASGCDAIPVLVKELHVVPHRELSANAQEKYPQAEHVVWSIAALRYITGQDFYAAPKTRGALHAYSDEARQFLPRWAPKGELKFFDIWPSRGTLFLSPPDVQKKIIAQWKTYSSSHSCTPSSWEGRKNSTFWMSGDRGEDH